MLTPIMKPSASCVSSLPASAPCGCSSPPCSSMRRILGVGGGSGRPGGGGGGGTCAVARTEMTRTHAITNGRMGSQSTLCPMPQGFHGRVLFVDLGSKTSRVETVDPKVYRDYLGGYGLGASLMWQHYPK